MTAAKAIAAFTTLESDLSAKAIDRSKSLVCEIPIRSDDGTVGVVKVKSSSTGVISFVDKDGNTSLTRAQFLDAYVTLNASRLDVLNAAKDAMETAKSNAYYAAENIDNIRNAKGEY
ncbi:MAG: hypothetical protein ABI876_04300 [Bacteroidota bacterium]